MKRFKAQQIYLLFILILGSFLISGCGGDGDTTGHWLPGNHLMFIQVTPATASIPMGITRQFTAVATYSNGRSIDVTASSIWTSGTVGVATVNRTSGLARGVTIGTSVITATYGGMSGSGTLTVTAATLSSIAVTPATASIPMGLTKTFVATGTYSDGTSLDISNVVTWTSGTIGVATVVSPGVATGVSVGTSTITAALSGKSGSGILTVTAATLSSIAVTPATASIPMGLTKTFVATGTYSDGTTLNISNVVTWTSGTIAVATVVSPGVATGVSAGTSTITAALSGKSGSAVLTVTAATLSSIAVTPATATTPMGLTKTFVATGTYSDGTTLNISNLVTWTSGTIAVATVVSPGVATGVSAGTSTITAALSGKSGSGTLTVTAATLSSIAVTPAAATVQAGLTKPFFATGTYSDGSTADITADVAWTSGTIGVATVLSTTGVATGVSAGSSTITAALSGKSGSGNLTVTAVTLTSIAVTPAAATVQIGGKKAFIATGTYSDGSTAVITNIVTWTSGTIGVATVLSTTGVATGVSAGTSIITATLSGKSGSGTLTVAAALGPPPVDLGTAEDFVILTKSGITDVPSSAITGNIGSSPITGAAIGVTCPEVTGLIYSVDAAGPACAVIDPTLLGIAVGDMQIAYTDAAGRPAGVGPNLNIGAGTVAGQTLAPGTYTWGSNVSITTNLTLNGGPNDVWIFQITGTLNLSPSMNVVLTGGALPKNIFWQVAGTVTLGTGSHFEGTILAQTNIAMNTGASINGRLLAQTAATLQSNAVTKP